ncbi:OmpA family protein [Rhodovulum sp.]|uniref:OmpA family protein n=1 Tax=Rhodovulum sp. TaxID=34009 RepID=UPI0017AF4D57|nr:OmpA family protein [Rhodovulum sp.]HDR27970.1 OmpA family protein [Rhodovulum sp.]
MRFHGLAVVLAALLAPGAVAALAPPEGATATAEEQVALGTVAVPVGGYDGTHVPVIVAEGAISRRAWHESLDGRTTMQILAPLRDRLLADGFLPILDCAAETCGGFDFRFATDTLPAPAMHVDLGDFRFLSARRLTRAGPEYATLMVSRSSTRGFVQVTRIRPAAAPETAPRAEAPQAGDDLAARLDRDGRAVLPDLDFDTGAATLNGGDIASLQALAQYLADNPGLTLMLVGHTDAVGALEGNIALSRRRAEAVRAHLVERLGVPAARVTAAGAGFLAPVASNRSEEGRMQNRRVEAIVTALE